MPNTHNQLDRGGPADRLLAWRQVGEMTGLSRTTAWRRQKARDFPEPVLVSPGRVCWWESDVISWKRSRLEGGRSDLPRFQGAVPKRSSLIRKGGR